MRTTYTYAVCLVRPQAYTMTLTCIVECYRKRDSFLFTCCILLCISLYLCLYFMCKFVFLSIQLGTSPLHFAAQFGHMQTAEVLLRAGISRDARTKVDRTPLHVACQEGHSEIVELLVRSGADIEAKDMVGIKA